MVMLVFVGVSPEAYQVFMGKKSEFFVMTYQP
jgi:hypothetical protein